MKRIVLLSGGLDSAVCLALARRDGEVTALHFQYGQSHAVSEGAASQRIADHYGVPMESIELPLRLGESALGGGAGHSGVSRYYVPGRNLAMLALANNRAESIGAREVHVGFNLDDYGGFPDCRPVFVAAAERVLWGRVVAPLLYLSKCDVVDLARQLDVPIELTTSCYAGNECGECDACTLRAAALR